FDDFRSWARRSNETLMRDLGGDFIAQQHPLMGPPETAAIFASSCGDGARLYPNIDPRDQRSASLHSRLHSGKLERCLVTHLVRPNFADPDRIIAARVLRDDVTYATRHITRSSSQDRREFIAPPL